LIKGDIINIISGHFVQSFVPCLPVLSFSFIVSIDHPLCNNIISPQAHIVFRETSLLFSSLLSHLSVAFFRIYVEFLSPTFLSPSIKLYPANARVLKIVVALFNLD